MIGHEEHEVFWYLCFFVTVVAEFFVTVVAEFFVTVVATIFVANRIDAPHPRV